MHRVDGVRSRRGRIPARQGFGDITARSETARVVLIVRMLADLAILGAGLRVLLGAVQRGRERRPDAGDDTRPAAT